MSKLRMIGMAGGTLACALGIGYVMQRGQPAPPPIAALQQPAPAKPILQASAQPAAGPVQTVKAAPALVEPLALEKIALTSAATDDTPPRHRPAAPAVPEPAVAPGPDAALPATPDDPEIPSLGCDVTAQAVPGGMAVVDFTVSAPCMGNARLVVHHNGMIFTAVTDEDGQLNVAVPALAERAVFIAAFDNGDGAVATARVTDIDEYDRVVLQWQGKTGFQIHAREFGAGYGQPGHVWSGSATAGTGDHATGAVVRLGAGDTLAPLMAEVYTFPSGAADRSGSIALSVEAEVTADNCGRDISAQLLQRQGADRVKTRDLDLAVPDCGATGDFLVLNNLLDDLKIAAK